MPFTCDITLTGVNATISLPSFCLGGVNIQGALQASYMPATKEFGFVGDAKLQAIGLASDSGSSFVDVKIGAPGNPGLVIGQGSLKQFNLALSGSFKVCELLIQPRNLTFQYNTDQNSGSSV